MISNDYNNIYYLCAQSTAARAIADRAQYRYIDLSYGLTTVTEAYWKRTY
jgi:hypothetical protein